ncbi:MAG: bile acid:sodium symporter [Verrucomicrobia bacterium]|nr:bile acid:sodium symporter [Verrucomicrobiota bacterium]
MKLKFDWFLCGLVLATVLAWLAPGPGAAGGWMHPELLTKGGIALIFFLHGLALSFAALKAGSLRWPLHLLVQASTFLLFPLIGLGVIALLGDRMGPDLKLGFFYLCALPSTVSSSVAMTAAAKGNVAGAVFNATLSSLIGVFLTPLWIALLLKSGAGGHALAIGPVIWDLTCWLVLPLVVGQLCRPWLGAWAGRHKPAINLADRATILLLVYTSFCDSFKEGIWSGHGPGLICGVIAGTFFLFVAVMLIMGRAARALHFSREDRIAAMFCGSKKTLASGVPMAKLIFAGHPGIGLILLPIMIYHPLQLVICGVLAQRWGREVSDKNVPTA